MPGELDNPGTWVVFEGETPVGQRTATEYVANPIEWPLMFRYFRRDDQGKLTGIDVTVNEDLTVEITQERLDLHNR